jgi:adenylate cyclase
MQVSRVYGQALSHVAQTEVNVFRSRTERRLREITPGRIEALAAVRQAFGWLLPLADPILVGVHRRKIEQELTQATVWEVESEAEGLVPGSREVSLAFCDLKDFTAYANARGDAAAIQALERLTEAVEEHRGSGVVVKALGDGYMLAYPRPDDAVAAVLAIGSAMREADDIAVHAGSHHGLAVFREGDYFGRAVNLASRLLATAGAGELAATEDVAVSTPAYPWRERGRRKLRGFDEPHEIYALDLESAPKQSRPG